MTVKIPCPKCKSPLNISARMSGRKGKCPKCAVTFKVPEKLFAKTSKQAADGVAPHPAEKVSRQAPQTAQPTAKKTARATNKAKQSAAAPVTVAAKKSKYREQLLAALDQPIARVKKSPLYALSSALVTFVMILLPILYICFIGLVGYGVYWHLMNNGWLASLGRGRIRILMVLVYLAPAIAGGIGVLFMFKPLLARPAKRPRTRSLTRSGEPLLFEFVDRICVAVGSPKPSQIDVDNQMNASASFRRGIISMFGTDMVLTIGMPLAAGLTLRQFAGVLAHEFGHFSQGMGMRLSYLIRSINHWFARVVYERDEWDELLAESMSEMDFRIGWVFALAQLFVMLSRFVLMILMWVGQLVSGMLLRQMEYDADLYEARLVGNDVFASTSKKLEVLSVSTEIAHQNAFQFFQQGSLADDFSALTMHYHERMPPEIQKQLDSAESPKTSLFSTHPSNPDRIASVRRHDNPGVFRVEGKTRDLFKHFDATSKNVTWDFYCEFLGNVKRNAMRPVQELLDAEKVGTAAAENSVEDDLPPLPLD